jgi:hypothetical protein
MPNRGKSGVESDGCMGGPAVDGGTIAGGEARRCGEAAYTVMATICEGLLECAAGDLWEGEDACIQDWPDSDHRHM